MRCTCRPSGNIERGNQAEEIFAMCTVEFNNSDGRERRGSIGAPSPRTPHPGSDYATVNVLLRQQQKGDISNEVRMGIFLTRLDSGADFALTNAQSQRKVCRVREAHATAPLLRPRTDFFRRIAGRSGNRRAKCYHCIAAI